MATAAKSNTTEGKTATINSTPLCDGCETDEATKYCLVCPGPLCDNCIKSHLKSKLTKNHTLSELPLPNLRSSYFKSGEPLEGLSRCSKHLDKEMDHFCNDCTCLLCADCKSEHRGHTVHLARDDITAHREVYHDHVARMLREEKDLELYKINVEKTIQQYEDACEKVDEKEENLIVDIKENATRLRGELRTVQGELKQLLGDAQHGLIKKMDYTDKEITKLRGFRKSDDCEVLSHVLVNSGKVLNNLNEYKKKITRRARTPRSKNVLPYENEIDSLKDYVRMYFVMETSFDASIKSCAAVKSNIVNISNPQGDQGYRFCKSPVKGNLIIHGKSTKDIRLLKDNFTDKKQFTSEFEIWNMVKVHHNEHIAIHMDRSKILLLDESFTIIFRRETNQKFTAICYYGLHQFVLCEKEDTKFHFSIISVKNKSFVKQREMTISGINDITYLELYPDQNHCLAVNKDGLLYKVNLSNGNFTKHDVTAFVKAYIWSVFIDENSYVIIGDAYGSVHTFDDQMNHEIIAKVDDNNNAARDILVRDNRLFISSGDNKIYVYSSTSTD